MREIRTSGSEGGEAASLPYPYPARWTIKYEKEEIIHGKILAHHDTVNYMWMRCVPFQDL